MKKMAIPNVWPLHGTVMKCYQQFYSDGNPTFPPVGMSVEVCYHDSTEADLGTFTRENCDVPFLAWLMLLKEICDDSPKYALFLKASQCVTMNFHQRSSEVEKLWAAYQMKEHEEAAADMLGHSVLSRARELAALQEQCWHPLSGNAPAFVL